MQKNIGSQNNLISKKMVKMLSSNFCWKVRGKTFFVFWNDFGRRSTLRLYHYRSSQWKKIFKNSKLRNIHFKIFFSKMYFYHHVPNWTKQAQINFSFANFIFWWNINKIMFVCYNASDSIIFLLGTILHSLLKGEKKLL